MTEKKYTGFGHEHTAKEWARMLGIKRADTFLYCIERLGLTVEELFHKSGLSYPGPKKRKQREGGKMKDTQSIMYQILVQSGYLRHGGIEYVTVKPLDKNGNHLVYFQKSFIGIYNYRAGTLRFQDGSGIPITKLVDTGVQVKLQISDQGFWEVTPETRRAMWLSGTVSLQPEPTQEEYEHRTRSKPTGL